MTTLTRTATPRSHRSAPIRTLALLFAGMLAVFALTPPAPAAADGLGHDAVIASHVDNTYNLLACRDWGSTTCLSTSAKCNLRAGQTTKSVCGWADADGYYIPTGAKRPGPGGAVGPRWVKVAGCFGCTVNIRLIRA